MFEQPLNILRASGLGLKRKYYLRIDGQLLTAISGGHIYTFGARLVIACGPIKSFDNQLNSDSP